MPELDHYSDLYEQEILTKHKTPEARFETFYELMSRSDDYPANSTNFPRIQALLLRDLVGLATGAIDLDTADD